MMRPFPVLVWWLTGACVGAGEGPLAGAAPGDLTPPIPIVVRGAGDPDLVVDVRELRAAAGAEPGCWRASDPAACRDLRQRVRGEPDLAAAAGDDQLVLIVRGAGERLLRIEVATEEGVDVLTLVALGAAPAAGPEPSAWLLRLRRRPHQLAIVVRGAAGDSEATVAVFDGLPDDC